MKKEILVVTVILLLAVLMATPLIACAQAAKTTIVFSSYRTVAGGGGVATDANQKTSQDGDEHLLIRWGTFRNITYSNPAVGTGRMYLTTVRSITNYEVPPSTPGATQGVAKGHGIYTVKIDMPSGSRVGTLEGFAIMTWEWDFTSSPATHVQSANYTLMQGTGGFEGAKLDYDSWNIRYPNGSYGVWTAGELVLP